MILKPQVSYDEKQRHKMAEGYTASGDEQNRRRDPTSSTSWACPSFAGTFDSDQPLLGEMTCPSEARDRSTLGHGRRCADAEHRRRRMGFGAMHSALRTHNLQCYSVLFSSHIFSYFVLDWRAWGCVPRSPVARAYFHATKVACCFLVARSAALVATNGILGLRADLGAELLALITEVVVRRLGGRSASVRHDGGRESQVPLLSSILQLARDQQPSNRIHVVSASPSRQFRDHLHAPGLHHSTYLNSTLRRLFRERCAWRRASRWRHHILCPRRVLTPVRAVDVQSRAPTEALSAQGLDSSSVAAGIWGSLSCAASAPLGCPRIAAGGFEGLRPCVFLERHRWRARDASLASPPSVGQAA